MNTSIIKNAFKKNYLFFIIIFLYFINLFINNIIIALITISFVYLCILFCKKETSIILSISTVPCMGVFDDVGFLYFYNFALLLLLIKLSFINCLNCKKINIKIPILIFILVIYNLVIQLYSGLFSIKHLIDLCGFIISSLTLFFALYEDINVKKLCKILTIFMIVSFIIGFIKDTFVWGFPLPDKHRLIGLMRDPNYFSAWASILIFSSIILHKKINLSTFILFLAALLSFSKMFLIICIISSLCLIVIFFNNILNFIFTKKRTVYCQTLFVSLSAILVVFFCLLGFFVIDKYFIRFSSTTLTTGRTFIWNEYITRIINDPFSMVFGRSISYSSFYTIYYTEANMVAHNTLLDIILSYGIFGTFIIILFLYNYISNIRINKNNITIFIILLIITFSLSWLMIDHFYILLLYIIFFLKYTSHKIINFNLESGIKINE